MTIPRSDSSALDARQALWKRIGTAIAEELQPLASRKVLAHVARSLPQQALSRTRTALLRAAGVRIGPRSLFQGPLQITGAANACELLSLGTFTLVSGCLHVDLGAPITIGDQVRIGHDVTLLTIDHEVGPEQMRSGARKFGPIVIGNGAWLASRVVVLPGITIGAGSIVAAGALVSRDVPPNTLVAGVPARVVRNLNRAENPDEVVEAPPSSRKFAAGRA